MMKHLLVLLVGCLAASVSGLVASADEVPKPSPLVSQARAILERSARFISAAERFHLEASVVFDIVDESGRSVEFGVERSLWVRRPDHVRIEVHPRSGGSLQVVADGKAITALRQPETAYAKRAVEGDLDAVVDFVIGELGARPPLVNFLYSDLWAVLKPRIASATVIGAETIDGVRCDHIAFWNPDVEWQIWIEQGQKPLPKRIVGRYKEQRGAPSFRATIRSWELDAKLEDKDFVLKIPKNAPELPMIDLVSKDAVGAD